MKTSLDSIRNPSFGALPSTAQGSSSSASVDDRGAPVDAQRVADARDHEEQPDVRVARTLRSESASRLPGPLGNEQRPLVEDVDEPGRIAARAHVAGPVRRRVASSTNGDAVDELAREVVEAVAIFAWTRSLGSPINVAQLAPRRGSS